MKHSQFNNEGINLEILAEEAAEIIQAKSKIVRFGLDDYHPKNIVPNREKLEEEIGHFMAIVEVLTCHGTIRKEGIMKGKKAKLKKMKKWYFHKDSTIIDV